MKSILKENKLNFEIELAIQNLLESGFKSKRGCVILESLYQDHFDNYKISTFTDETGFEAFVNSIRISDYTSLNQIQNGLVFIILGIESYILSAPNENMSASMSINSGEVTVKFYKIRNGIQRLDDDLESYEEAAMLELDKNGIIELKKFFQPQDKI